MKKPRIPNSKTSTLYTRLFKNEFHPAPSYFHGRHWFKFYRTDGRQMSVKKVGCSDVSANGVSFLIDEKELKQFITPELIGLNTRDYDVKMQSNNPGINDRMVVFNYTLPDSISTATFQYAGNTYEVF